MRNIFTLILGLLGLNVLSACGNPVFENADTKEFAELLKRKDVRSPQTESIETDNVDKKDEESGNDSYQQLQQLIEALPEESSVVIRAFLDGFSYKEIAEMTNSSVGAVAMRIARLKRKLKKMYERENNL